MWLSATDRTALGASAHQFAAFRIAVGLLLVLCLAVGLDAVAPASWLELPRWARAAARLLALAAGFSLSLGVFRRSAAGVGIAATAVAAGFGFLVPSVALALSLLTLLAALPALDSEPWVALPKTSVVGPDVHPQPYWTTAAWATFALSSLVTAASTQTALGLALLGATVLGIAFVATRGPAAWLVYSLLGLSLASSWLSPAPLAHLCLLACATLALMDEQWLPAAEASEAESVVFYDGVCGLCQASVQLIVREDRHARLKFAPLQGETAQLRLPPSSAEPDSMLVITRAGVLRESDAWLCIAQRLGGAWRVFEPIRYVPRPLRDAMYRWIARNRYDWFGKLDACPIPDASVRARFLP